MEEKYLPVGTVVMLKNGKKRLMIVGFCCYGEDKSKIYDYSGVMYPEGLISSDANIMFNHEQIEKIYHVGPMDEDAKKFNEKLREMYS